MFAGTLLCDAAMREGRSITFFPTYGAEMRGGTAKCHIIISDEPIGAPIVYEPDMLIALNKESFGRYAASVKRGGAIFANTSLYEPFGKIAAEVLGVPANNIAERCGSVIVANIVMLGALVSKTGIVDGASVIGSIPEVLAGKKKEFCDINRKAFEAGAAYFTEERAPLKK